MTITKAARTIHLCATGWTLWDAYGAIREDDQIANAEEMEAAYKAYYNHVVNCQECTAKPKEKP